MTVIRLMPLYGAVELLVNRVSESRPLELECRTITLGKDKSARMGKTEITMVDLRGEKVRLGVSAPRESTVHRLEVYEAIRREREGGSGSGSGMAGSPVPRPPSPRPPSLDVRLDEPPPEDI